MRKDILTILFTVALTFPGISLGQAPGHWTLGVGAGTASHELTYYNLYDYNDKAQFLSLQRKITSWVSLEGRYVDLGSTRGNFFYVSPGTIGALPNTMATSAKGLALAPVFTIPLNKHWHIGGRVGLSYLSVEESILGGTVNSSHGKEKQTNFYSGIMVDYLLNQTFSLGGSWDLYKIDTSKGNLDVNHYAITFKARF